MVLTAKQQGEVNLAILEYLTRHNFSKAAAAFALESDTSSESLEERHSELLDKKWGAVLRLQKKVMQLEERLKEAESEARLPRAKNAQADSSLWVPRPPAQCVAPDKRAGENKEPRPQRPSRLQHRHTVASQGPFPTARSLCAATDPRCRFELVGHRNELTAVACHPIYALAATASEDASIKVGRGGRGT